MKTYTFSHNVRLKPMLLTALKRNDDHHHIYTMCKLGRLECETREHSRGKYHCAVELLFDLFGLICFANKSKNCQFSYS